MKHFKALFGLAMVVTAFYAAFLLIPIYYNNYSFQDELDNQARQASYSNGITDQDVQEILARKAKELEIPLGPDQIHVARTGNEITITTQYTVNIHTPIRDFELKFEPSTKNKRI